MRCLRAALLILLASSFALAQCPAGSVPNRWSRDLADRTHIIECIRRSDGMLVLPDFPGPLISTNYNFAPISRSTPMTGGAAFTLNVSPCPEGVNGTNTNHYLYLSGLPGAPEAVLITGGTCRSGRPVGTISFTPANNHLGQWTLSSATAGGQEAVWAVALEGAVLFPAGQHIFYATLTVPPSKLISLRGVGMTSSVLLFAFAVGDGIYYNATTYGYTDIADLRLHPLGVTPNGFFLHVLKGGGSVRNIAIISPTNGARFENCPSLLVNNVQVQAQTSVGIDLYASAGYSGGTYVNSGSSGNGYGLYIHANGAGTGFAGLFLSNIGFQSGTRNIYINPNGGVINEILMENVIVDSWSSAGILMYDPTGAGSGTGIVIRNLRGTTGSVVAGIALVDIHKGFSNIQLSGITGGGRGGGIFLYGVKNVRISDVHLEGGSEGGGGSLGLIIAEDGATVCDAIYVHDSSFGFDGYGAGSTYTVGIRVTAVAHTNIFFHNVRANGAAAGLDPLGTGTIQFRDSIFLNTVKPVASAVFRSSIWTTESAPGVIDAHEICRKDALNAYLWVGLY